MAKIGEILVQKGYVTQQQLDGVLSVKGDDAQVGQVLIQWGLLTEQQLMEALEIQTPPPPPPPPPHPPTLNTAGFTDVQPMRTRLGKPSSTRFMGFVCADKDQCRDSRVTFSSQI